MKKYSIFKDEIESFGDILDTLTMLNKDNVLIFNNELIIFVLEDNVSIEYFNKTKDLKKTVDMQYFIFNKDGVLINETVDLIADVRNQQGKHLGYILRLPNICAITELDLFDKVLMLDSSDSKDKAILFYSDQYKRFICNNIENEIIRNSCIEVDESLSVQGDNGGYILRMEDKTYNFSRLLVEDLDGNSHTNISNIGQFTERAFASKTRFGGK